MQEGVDNALEQLEAEGGAVLLADGGQGGRVVAQRVKLGGGDVASRHIMGQVVQKQVRVGLRRKGRGILGVQVQVELPVLLGEAVPRTAQEPHGGRVGQAEPPVEQKQALHEVGAAHLLAQIQRGGQAQVRAAGVAGKGQAVAPSMPQAFPASCRCAATAAASRTAEGYFASGDSR